MSYIRNPIYLWMDLDGMVYCGECGVVGETDKDAYRHMIYHAKKFQQEEKYIEADVIEMTVASDMIGDVLEEKGVLTREDMIEIDSQIEDWEEEFEEEEHE